jgi:tRNA(Ile)-lysidine synthase
MDFTRNRIRNMLIPLLKNEFNPNIINTLAKTAISFDEDNSVLSRLADKAYETYAVSKKSYILIRKEAFNALPSAVLKRLIRKCAQNLSGSITDFESIHTEMVLEMFSKPTGKSYSLTKGLKCANVFGDIAVYKESAEKLTPKELKSGDFVYIDEDYGYISISLGKPLALENYINTCIAVFNCDRINEYLMIRNRRHGDIFIKPNGTEIKLKDYMINRKIPWFIRDNIPVLACGNEIIWVLNENIQTPVSPEDTRECLFIQLWRAYGREQDRCFDI